MQNAGDLYARPNKAGDCNKVVLAGLGMGIQVHLHHHLPKTAIFSYLAEAQSYQEKPKYSTFRVKSVQWDWESVLLVDHVLACAFRSPGVPV